MASSNAGPITGSELLHGIQGETEVLLTRPQVSALLAKQAILRPRVYTTPTAFSGNETFLVLQNGSSIRFNTADLTTYLAATGTPDAFPERYAVLSLSGAELLLGVQDTSLVALNTAEVGLVRTGGAQAITSGSLALIWDSIGVGETAGGHVAFNQLGYPAGVTLLNISASGKPLSSALTDVVTNGAVDSAYTATAPSVAIIGDGTNDMANNGGSTQAAALYANSLIPMVAYLKRKGFFVIAQKILPRALGSFGWTSAQETQRVSYNNLIAANTAGADLIVDYSASPLDDPTNATYYSADQLHPNALGQDTITPRMKAATNTLLSGLKRFPDVVLSSTAATANAAYSATFTRIAGSTVTATSSDGTALTVSGSTISGTFTTNGSPTITLSQTGAGFESKTNTTTLAVGSALNYLRLSALNNLTETGDSSVGYTYTPTTLSGANYGNPTASGFSTKHLAASVDGWITYNVVNAAAVNGTIMGLCQSANPSGYGDITLGVFQDASGSQTHYQTLPGGSASTVLIAVGDIARVRRTGSFLYSEVSKDSGATWIGITSVGLASTIPVYAYYQAGLSNPISKPTSSASFV
jgi:hypothetical protein